MMAREKRMNEEACTRDENEFNEKLGLGHRNVIYPDYHWDKTYKINREARDCKPPPTLYLALGYDRDVLLLKNPDPEANHMEKAMKTALLGKLSNAQIQEESKADFDAPPSQLLGDRPDVSSNGLADKMKDIRKENQELMAQEVKPDVVVKEDSDNLEGTGVLEKKHYRRFYNDELEKVKDLFP